MRRRGRFVVVLLVALMAGAAGVYLLLRTRDGAPARPFEADRTYFVSQIIFSFQKNTGLAGRRRADAAHELIRKGTPFAEVASAQTDSEADRGTGGFASAVPVYLERPTALHGAVQMLAEGQLGPPLFTDMGWHVLYRHTYEEGRALDQRIFIPAWAFRVTWRELEGGADRSKDEAHTLAVTTVRALRAGTLTFAQARTQYGTPGQERADGWYGRLDRRKSWEQLYDALKAVPEGAYVEPLEASDGWVVMRRGTNFRCVVRHIVVQHIQSDPRDLNINRLKPDAEARARTALEKAQADISRWPDLVRAYSDDTPTIDDEGSFGCIAPGQLPLVFAALDEAVIATPPGQLHPNLVETSMGYHVIWRVD